MACEIVHGQANQSNCPGKSNKHFENESKKELAKKIPSVTDGIQIFSFFLCDTYWIMIRSNLFRLCATKDVFL